VVATEIKHTVPCLAFAVTEVARRRINAAALDSIGVPSGPAVRRLVRGEAAVLRSGRVVQPAEVLTELRSRRFGAAVLFRPPLPLVAICRRVV
jgi:ribonuclease BN (tRNA processing enzyme)